MATDPTPDSKPPAANGPPAMTPYAIAVALFAAFVVGGVLGKVVPLWVVVVVGLAVGAAVFVFVDRYPRLPGRGWTQRALTLFRPLNRNQRPLRDAGQPEEAQNQMICVQPPSRPAQRWLTLLPSAMTKCMSDAVDQQVVEALVPAACRLPLRQGVRPR
jgi:hypothetical protein